MKRIIKTITPEDGERLTKILSDLEEFLAYWWGDRQPAKEYVDGVEADILEHDEDLIEVKHERTTKDSTAQTER